MIADRMKYIDASGIRKVFDLAKKMKNPINLSIGQPDFDVPEEIKSEAIQAIQKGYNKYTPTQGIDSLRTQLLQKIKAERGFEAEDILITSGVSGGILLSFMTLLNPGDEVIIPDPYFVMYKHLSRLLGAVPIYLDTYPDFIVTAESLKEKISSRTKLIILNSPANPTGAVIPSGELRAIARVCESFGITILSDEIYSSFCYDEPFDSVARYYPKTLILDGFSKSHAMTGWRMGYAAGSSEIIQAMTKLQQFSFVCAPSFAQYAALKALSLDLTGHTDLYRKKRDLIYQGLSQKFEVQKPSGAFYIFPKAPNDNADEFSKKAMENNLLIISGSVFSEKNTHFRISYAASEETLLEGLEILNQIS